MAPALAPRLLTLALFLFMIGKGISARDLKVEQQDQKQMDSKGAVPVSSDEPYIAAYITTTTEPNYAASYNTKKHHHPSHHGNTNEPYINGYVTTTPPGTRKANQPTYSASYRAGTHDSNEPYIAGYTTTPLGTGEANQPYIASYRAHSESGTHEPNGPYIASYGTHSGPSTLEPNGPPNGPYIASYGAHSESGTHEPNGPYIASYGAHSGPSTHEPNGPPNGPYIASYGAHSGPSTHEPNGPYIASYTAHSEPGTHEPNQPYIASYEAHSGPGIHEPNGPYIAAYQSNAIDSNQHVLDAKKAPKDFGSSHETTQAYDSQYGGKKDPKESTSAEDCGEQYLNQYGGKIPKHGPKEFTSAQDSGQQYLTQYGDRILRHDTKESTSSQDSGENFITQYGHKTPKHDPKESTSAQDLGQQYLTQYEGKTPKHDPKTSTQGYEARYKKKSRNVDHTEAFKTGFFALDDLYAGNVMTLQFPVQEISPFLSKKGADSIPFSLSQLPSALQLFSIPENSPKAKSMRGTLEQCEGEPITGERKTCATSLESMLEFVDSVIGSNTKSDLLTTSHPTPSGSPLQKYTILEVSQDIDAPKWVACHPLPYSYAVYYCHFISTGTKVFKVSLGGENGDRVEALGVCHLDTSDWNPSHIVFKQLGIEAGKDPVCHYLPIKHLMWIPQTSKATM